VDGDGVSFSSSAFCIFQATPGAAPHSGQASRHQPARRI
jgi:hypothetical protein